MVETKGFYANDTGLHPVATASKLEPCPPLTHLLTHSLFPVCTGERRLASISVDFL